MSFSSQVKKDLCSLPFEADGCVRAELSGIFSPSATIAVNEDLNAQTIIIKTEHPAVAGRIFRMVKSLYKVVPDITIHRLKQFKNHRSYEITIGGDVKRILKDLRILRHNAKNQQFYVNEIPPFFQSKQRFILSYIRGVYLSCGSITDPEKGYRLELTGRQKDYLASLAQVLEHYDIHTNLVKRKANYVLYMKEAESVAAFLGIVGAHRALLEMENIRVVKEVRNDVNRKVNCDMANMNKTSAAAQEQIATIRRLDKKVGLSNLPPGLHQLAELRLNNPDVTIKELGEMMDPPVGKSGVYHRLAKLGKLANAE